MLSLQNIHKRYGVRRVLEGVSFSLGEGQKAAIVGGNEDWGELGGDGINDRLGDGLAKQNVSNA
jgi:ABC-type phosphonate transport system ATPase subunit